MRSIRYSAGLTLLALCITAAMPAHAVTFTGKAVGSWSNPSATGSVYTIANNDDVTGPASVASFDFGSPASSADNSNLFTFNGVGSGGTTPFSTPANTAVDIGKFTYRNGTTSGSSYPEGNSSVKFGVGLTLTSPVMNTVNFSYNYAIDITPNTTGNPVLDADTVSISNGLTQTTFTSGGTTYTLALLGFSQDGGKSFTNTFVAPEETTTSAELYATITSNVAPVPEPASMLLLGTGVLGVALRRRATSARS